MRVYFEKPRTTVGWKGLINDPTSTKPTASTKACALRQQLLIDINRLGMPAGSEFLDVISPQYIGDLIAWGAIGARTTESQVHRELASGPSAPSASRTARTATSASPPTPSSRPAAATTSLSVHKERASGHRQHQCNKDCHVILRGGKAPTMTPPAWPLPARTWKPPSCPPR